ncbi:MAG: sulfotransferase family 2 domain-containing protein [Alcanivorax sp.]|nr:sulfotransferase family 2 domain-containing protein [Alcanivorax sp.]
MLISEHKQFIFIHIEKTGGTSVRAVLREHAIPRPQSRWYSLLRQAGLPRDYRHYRFPTHCGLSLVQSRLPPEDYQRFFKFAFVRNPWDRLVSEYNAALHKHRRRRHRHIAGLETFADYVRYEARRGKLHQAPRVLDRAGNPGLDFVGRYENLAADFAIVCTRLGLANPLPVTNRFPHRPYQEYYDARTRDLVARHWQRDIELFGYQFS